MAEVRKTFEQRVENLACFTITKQTRPSEDDISQFLKDGQRDIANRLKVLDPASLLHITTTTTGVDDISVPSGIVLQVERENGNSGQYVKATPIDSSLQNEISRSTSIHYQSSHHPVYYLQNNTLTVVPTASSSGGQTKVTYVKFDDEITYDDYTLDGYTEKYVDLLVQYCAIKSLRIKLVNLTLQEEDVELAPVLIATLKELKDYYDQGFLSTQALQQGKQESQQQQPERRR